MELVSDLCFSYGLRVYIHYAAVLHNQDSEGLSSSTPSSEVNGYIQFFHDEERFASFRFAGAKPSGKARFPR